jgi:hypothetical protein
MPAPEIAHEFDSIEDTIQAFSMSIQALSSQKAIDPIPIHHQSLTIAQQKMASS